MKEICGYYQACENSDNKKGMKWDPLQSLIKCEGSCRHPRSANNEKKIVVKITCDGDRKKCAFMPDLNDQEEKLENNNSILTAWPSGPDEWWPLPMPEIKTNFKK